MVEQNHIVKIATFLSYKLYKELKTEVEKQCYERQIGNLVCK